MNKSIAFVAFFTPLLGGAFFAVHLRIWFSIWLLLLSVIFLLINIEIRTDTVNNFQVVNLSQVILGGAFTVNFILLSESSFENVLFGCSVFLCCLSLLRIKKTGKLDIPD